MRAASNAWLPQPQRVISLPERGENIRQTVDKLWMFLEAAESADDIAYERRKPKVNEGLAGLTNEEVWEAVHRYWPLALILVGLAIILRRRTQVEKTQQTQQI